MRLNPDLLKILACPDCKSPVQVSDETLVCVNASCRRQYSVKDNIPVMLIDESITLSVDEHQKLFHPDHK
ncbi:MAG: Trm112 family protein [Bacteroidetes bacterium]|nr:Trm112 family protein [Bacteroidota bacterium]